MSDAQNPNMWATGEQPAHEPGSFPWEVTPETATDQPAAGTWTTGGAIAPPAIEPWDHVSAPVGVDLVDGQVVEPRKNTKWIALAVTGIVLMIVLCIGCLVANALLISYGLGDPVELFENSSPMQYMKLDDVEKAYAAEEASVADEAPELTFDVVEDYTECPPVAP